MTTPISQTYQSQGAGSTAQVVKTGSDKSDKDMFMKLLVAQLKYQDPNSPTDSNAYMQQMATFSQVEKLGQLVDAQKTAESWQERLSAESMVGRQVTGTGQDTTEHTGVVVGVSFSTHDGPQLTLADGTTIAIGDVTKVELPSTTATPPTDAPTTTATPTTAV
jgi:flagellar basal-body rod modification protein FlgD